MADAAAAGSPFVIDEGSPGGEPLTRAPDAPAFFYAAHPERWQVFGGQIVPQLARIKIRGGLGGIGSSRNGRPTRIGQVRARWGERGWTVIPLDAIPDEHATAGEPRSYLWQPEGRPNLHLSIYELCFSGSARTACDESRFCAFLAHLVTSGIVAPCPIYVLERMRDDERRRADRAADAAHNVPSQAPVAALHAEHLAILDAEIDKRTAKAVPVTRGRAVAALESSP